MLRICLLAFVGLAMSLPASALVFALSNSQRLTDLPDATTRSAVLHRLNYCGSCITQIAEADAIIDFSSPPVRKIEMSMMRATEG